MKYYTINEHRHRFAAWAAGRAASASGCRFTVKQAQEILVAAKLHELLPNPNRLPAPRNLNKAHKVWRNKVIRAANYRQLRGMSHGIAAKLINVYLKSAFVCSGQHDHDKVKSLHPPIDRQLLQEVNKTLKERGGSVLPTNWTKFDSVQYEKVILVIRSLIQDKHLWKIEKYWSGYQR